MYSIAQYSINPEFSMGKAKQMNTTHSGHPKEY